MTPLLEVDDLAVHFETGDRVVRAVDGVDLVVDRGEALGLVGESGCGKSTLARALVGLVRATSGAIRFDGADVTQARGAGLRSLRRDVRIVFQDPYGALNPRMRVEQIIAQPLQIHGIGTRAERAARVDELLRLVGLDPAQAGRRPSAFSGGQRQRVGIARALALDPKLVVLDEPVSALDVSVQAQILQLLQRLRAELGVSFVLISHDLAVVRHLADRVAVMYLGRIVEVGDRDAVFDRPRHPYTEALLSAVPVADPAGRDQRRAIGLAGEPPDPADPPSGCRFRTRCPHADQRCTDVEPVLAPASEAADGCGPAMPDHLVACHHPR